MLSAKEDSTRTRPTQRWGFSRVDHPNMRTSHWRSAAETFRRSHRTRACVGGCFERERDAWTDRRRVKRSSNPAEARAPLCGGWTEKKADDELHLAD